jgi:hypothetical protein
MIYALGAQAPVKRNAVSNNKKYPQTLPEMNMFAPSSASIGGCFKTGF